MTLAANLAALARRLVGTSANNLAALDAIDVTTGWPE